MTSTGVTFTGLTEGTQYVAYADVGGNHRYVRIGALPDAALDARTIATRKITLTGETDEQPLVITPSGAVSASTSVGGAINVNNTGSTGAGVVIYSNQTGDANGRLLVVRADNALFDTQPVYVENDGISHGILVTHNSQGTNANAIAVASANVNDTAFGVSGRESGKGTIKVTHNKPDDVADGNASAISISLDRIDATETSAAQGIFLDTTHATTGRLVQLRQNGSEVWTVGSSGWQDMREQADPAAPAANFGRLYVRDNGLGKTQLCVRFPTGAVQVIATEP